MNRKRKRNAAIQKFFESDEDENIQKCTYCGTKIKIQKSSTSSMIKHAKSCKKNPNKIEYLTNIQPKITDSITSLENKRKAETIAIIMSGCPKSIVENIYFKKSFNPLLNRKQLTVYINKIYFEMRDKLLSMFAFKTVSVALDMQTDNVSKTKVLNFTILELKKCYFQKSIDTKYMKATGECLAKFTEDVIEELLRNNIIVAALIGDNASNNLKMFKIIEEKYPHIVYVNCASHCLQLMINDILKNEPFVTVMNNAQNIINVFEKNENKKILYDLQTAKNKKPLTLIKLVKTRQNSQIFMLERIFKLKDEIKNIDINLLDEKQETLLESTIKFFHPFLQISNQFEKNETTNTNIQLEMCNLEKNLLKYLNDPLFQNTIRKVQNNFEYRQDHTFNNEIAIVSAVLSKLSKSKENEKHTFRFIQSKGILILKHIFSVRKINMNLINDEIQLKLMIAEQFSTFCMNEYPLNNIPSNATAKQFQSLARFDIPELEILSNTILNMSATEASVERTFSSQKHIHRAERASLHHENTEKELFIKLNFESIEENYNNMKNDIGERKIDSQKS